MMDQSTNDSSTDQRNRPDDSKAAPSGVLKLLTNIKPVLKSKVTSKRLWKKVSPAKRPPVIADTAAKARHSRSSSPNHQSTTSSEARSVLHNFGEAAWQGIGPAVITNVPSKDKDKLGQEIPRKVGERRETNKRILELIGSSLSKLEASSDSATLAAEYNHPRTHDRSLGSTNHQVPQATPKTPSLTSTSNPPTRRPSQHTRTLILHRPNPQHRLFFDPTALPTPNHPKRPVPNPYKQKHPTNSSETTEEVRPTPQQEQEKGAKPKTGRLAELFHQVSQSSSSTGSGRILKGEQFRRFFQTEVTSVNWALLNKSHDSSTDLDESKVFQVDQVKDKNLLEMSKSLRKNRTLDTSALRQLQWLKQGEDPSELQKLNPTHRLLNRIESFRIGRTAELKENRTKIMSTLRENCKDANLSLPRKIPILSEPQTPKTSNPEQSLLDFGPLPALHQLPPVARDTLYTPVENLSAMALSLHELQQQTAQICTSHLLTRRPDEWLPTETNIATVERVCLSGGGVAEQHILGGVRVFSQLSGEDRIRVLGGGRVVRVSKGESWTYPRPGLPNDMVVLKGCCRLTWATDQNETAVEWASADDRSPYLAEIWEGQILTFEMIQVLLYSQRFSEFEQKASQNPDTLLQFLRLKDDPFIPLKLDSPKLLDLYFPVDSIVVFLQPNSTFVSSPANPSHFEKPVLTMANLLKIVFFHPLIRESKISLLSATHICDLAYFQHFKAGEELPTHLFGIVVTGRGVAAYRKGWIHRKVLGNKHKNPQDAEFVEQVVVNDDVRLYSPREPETAATVPVIRKSGPSFPASKLTTPNTSISIVRSSLLREPLPQDPAISARLVQVSRGDTLNTHILVPSLEEFLPEPVEIPTMYPYKVRVLSHRMTVCLFKRPVGEVLGAMDASKFASGLANWIENDDPLKIFPN